MKKLLIIIIVLFCIMIILPTVLVICIPTSKMPDLVKKQTENGPVVYVMHQDKNEIVSHMLEEYLVGVLAAEMPASFHEEALKAQAVAARTFIYNAMQSNENDTTHPGADICTDSTHCQAWISNADMNAKQGEEWYDTYYSKLKNAVQSTEGEIVTYNNEPIVAVFHSTASGRTENSEDVWGGTYPYLKSVESAGDKESPKFLSTITTDKDEVCRVLGVTEAKAYDIVRSEGGAVLTINIGGYLFKGSDIRSYFGLNSSNFEIEETENDFIFHVKGCGHGVGLSQYGANAMAKEGKSYRDILTTYYTDVTLIKAW